MQRDIGPAQSFPAVSSTPDRTLHPREDIHEQLEPRAVSMFVGVSRRGHVLISVWPGLPAGPLGQEARRGPRLNVPNVNYASGDPRARAGGTIRPPSEKVLVRISPIFISCCLASAVYTISLPRNYKIDVVFFLYTPRLRRWCTGINFINFSHNRD